MMITKRDIERAIDIEEMAYKITLACCRVLVSEEMHGKVVGAIAKAVRDEDEHTE